MNVVASDPSVRVRIFRTFLLHETRSPFTMVHGRSTVDCMDSQVCCYELMHVADKGADPDLHDGQGVRKITVNVYINYQRASPLKHLPKYGDLTMKPSLNLLLNAVSLSQLMHVPKIAFACFQVDLRYLLRHNRCRKQCCPCIYIDITGLSRSSLRTSSNPVRSFSRNASESSSSGYRKTSREIPAQVCKCSRSIVMLNDKTVALQGDTAF